MYFVGLICRAPAEEPRGTEEKVKFFTSYMDQKKKKKTMNLFQILEDEIILEMKF